jgi:hypothetical protein
MAAPHPMEYRILTPKVLRVLGDCTKDLYYFPSHIEYQRVFQGYHEEYSLSTAEIHLKGIQGGSKCMPNFG